MSIKTNIANLSNVVIKGVRSLTLRCISDPSHHLTQSNLQAMGKHEQS